MFWDLIQQNQINQANRQATRAENLAQRSADQTNRTIERLELKIDSLTLTCRALFEFLQDHGVITEQQLAEKMREIDLRDGKQDNRITPVVKECSGCGRKSSPNRTKCLYCGEACA